MILWTVSETNVSIVSINLPSCFQLYKRASDHGFWSLFRSGEDDTLPLTGQTRSTIYVDDDYGFSPIAKIGDGQFSRRSAKLQSGVYQPSAEGKELNGLAPAYIRKDVGVAV